MWVRVSTADRCRRKLKENTLERDLLADPFHFYIEMMVLYVFAAESSGSVGKIIKSSV